jgi:hypothetical protein
MLSRRFLLSLTVALAALAFTGQALAAGGRYAVDGGTTFERAQVRSALAASSFPWSVVHVRVRIHVRPGAVTRSVPGEIWVDAKLLDAGPYSWAYVQHEYAHQVDFYSLHDSDRARLNRTLGGSQWWWGRPASRTPPTGASASPRRWPGPTGPRSGMRFGRKGPPTSPLRWSPGLSARY